MADENPYEDNLFDDGVFACRTGALKPRVPKNMKLPRGVTRGLTHYEGDSLAQSQITSRVSQQARPQPTARPQQREVPLTALQLRAHQFYSPSVPRSESIAVPSARSERNPNPAYRRREPYVQFGQQYFQTAPTLERNARGPTVSQLAAKANSKH
jgi:hypothetical protein